ncbi:MAG: glycoside hydrolase family 16 protein [Candidatus Azobacteroides sp.]|nr:glycoside hydrolase family 16 protein [Candidatus Azobacteroides sp.]
MKNLSILSIIALLLSVHSFLYGQQGLSYQAVLRGNEGGALSNKDINVRFSIHNATEDGPVLYQETHQVKTDASGLFFLHIGEGTVISGVFESIYWQNSPYFIRTEVAYDESQYHINGVQELASVAYAKYAETAGGMKKAMADGNGTWQLTIDDWGNIVVVPVPAGYSKLVFHDEFNGSGLPDPNKWDYEEGYVRNGELQYYMVAREENCFQKDGHLYIRCINDNVFVKNALISQYPEVRKDTIVPITSTSIHTKGITSWKYCRVEMKAKLPVCKGSWSAIWMMPETEYYPPFYWPSGGEIDIMEHVGYDPRRVYYTAHCAKYNNETLKYHGNAAITNVDTEWHIYALEWHEDRIEWYLDGRKRYSILRPTDKVEDNDADLNALWRFWPYMHPFYLIINSAFGGGWGGREGTDPAALPQDYIIDYVRVFQ